MHVFSAYCPKKVVSWWQSMERVFEEVTARVFYCTIGVKRSVRLDHFCRYNWSSLIRAMLMASFSVLGQNSQITSIMSSRSPPMKVPTNAFWVQPLNQLPRCLNSFWYSRRGPIYFTLDKASSKSSHSVGSKRAQSSSTNSV